MNTILISDWVVDIGLGAGMHGGEVVYSGSLDVMLSETKRSGVKLKHSLQKQVDPSTTTLFRSVSAQDGRPCLYHQMGQCLGVCIGEITPAEYKKKVINPLT